MPRKLHKLKRIKVKKRFTYNIVGFVVLLLLIASFFTMQVFFPAKKVSPKGTFIAKSDGSVYHNATDFQVSIDTKDGALKSSFRTGNYGVDATLLGHDMSASGNVFSKSSSDILPGKDNKSVTIPIEQGAYLQYQVIETKAETGLKEFVYLKDKNSPRSYQFDLSLYGVDHYVEKKGNWYFYTPKNEVKFVIPRGVMEDSAGATSTDVFIQIDKKNGRNVLTLAPSSKWLDDPKRVWPVAVDPTLSVVVTGGITDAEASYGTMQRKIVYSASSNAWYAVFSNGTDVWYEKSTNGSTWGSAVDLDGTDADNINPTTWLAGQYIYVSWIDTGSNAVEVNRIDTASSDTQGTKCTSGAIATFASTFMLSLTVVVDGTVYFASTDTAAGAGAVVQKLTYSGCSFSSISTSSGLTNGDRPELTSIGNSMYMIFQDGQLSRSVYDGSFWIQSNITVASVTNSLYSVASNTTTSWILQLTAGGTTDTRLDGFGNVGYAVPDPNVGAGVTSADIACPTADNCKILYLDSGLQDIIFTDCNDTNCTSPTLTTIDSAVGSGGRLNLSISCPTSDNCKLLYQDIGANTVDFADCNDETCSSPTITTGIVSTIGTNAALQITCLTDANCKMVVSNPTAGTLLFIDCANAACSSGTTTTTLDAAYITASSHATSINCPTSDNCRVAASDNNGDNLTYYLCSDETCATRLSSIIDTDVFSATSVGNVSLSCFGVTCNILYHDGGASQDELNLVICSNALCSSSSTTTLDTSLGAASSFPGLSLSCLTSTNCKVLYSDNDGSNSGNMFFVDCNNATCSSTTTTQVTSSGINVQSVGLSCPTSNNCRGTGFATGGIYYLSYMACTDETCGSPQNVTAPYTGATNIVDLSLTVTNEGMLYAHILKDASEQAYYTYSNAALAGTSWSTPTSLGFTPGDMSQLSAVFNETSKDKIGLVTRQGTNLEMAFYDPATLANQTSILSAIGVDTDVYTAGGVSYVQATPKSETLTTSVSMSFSSLPTAGNMIVVYVWGWDNAAGVDFIPGSVTDNQGGASNTWTRATQGNANSGTRPAIFYAYNINAPSGTFTITVAPTIGGGSRVIVGAAVEYSGALTASDPLDQIIINSTGNSGSPTTGTSSVTTQANELVAVAMSVSANGAITTPGGYAARVTETDNNNWQAGEGADKIISVTGAQSATWSSGSGTWSGALATFKAAPGSVTLFSRLQHIDDTKLGLSNDTYSAATLFGRIGANTDASQCSGTLVGNLITAASCADETVFGIVRNLPGAKLIAQFGGDGSEGVIPASGTIAPGIHQYTGGNVTGTLAPTSVSPAGLFLFVKGGLTIASGGNISAALLGANGGNGGNNTAGTGTPGFGGGPDGAAGSGNLGGAGGPLALGGAGGSGASGASAGLFGGGGGGAGGNGGSSFAFGFGNGTATSGSQARAALAKRYGLLLSYGAGGGGGGVGSSNSSGQGGGGGGGGVIWIRAHSFINNGSSNLNVNGGSGGAFGANLAPANTAGLNGEGVVGGIGGNYFAGGNQGGGGGGGSGGGSIYIEANSVTIDSGGGLSVKGGNGGNGGNTTGANDFGASNGGAGANGYLLIELVP